jgi:hypothetical protein
VNNSSSTSSSSAQPELYTRSASRLAELFFPGLSVLGQFEPVTFDELPGDYRALLAHNEHMTVALETWHKSSVDVEAIDVAQGDSSYARASVLRCQTTGRVVQFGIMRIWLDCLPAEVRNEIVSQSEPLGRILIRHGLLREVEVLTLWRITPGPVLCEHLHLDGRTHIFGRSAQILVDERPTVQVLEIVTLPDSSNVERS